MRETLNPYRMALRLVLDRLSWDIRLGSRKNRVKLKVLWDEYKGKKAVILCNGPSLLDVDFELLKSVYTIGLNKVNLLFESNVFRPSCIVAINKYVLEQNREFYSQTDIPLFLDGAALRYDIPMRRNTCFLHSTSLSYFARDCSITVSRGYTVTYVALQLAFHLGFEKVCLVGCDHYFQGDGVPNELYTAVDDDISHFDKNYFSNGQSWQFPDLEQSEINYKLAKVVFENNKRSIYNASSNTHLQVFPRIELQKFLEL